MLSLACAAAAPAAPCAAGVCDSAERDLQGADSLLDELRLRSVDLGDPAISEDATETAARTTESLAPLLFLAPRVTSILEDVFQADARATAEDGAADAGTDAEAVLRSPVAETDPAASAHGPSPEMDHASILPKYPRQMYRTDI